jgi:hypothetical protein
VAACSVLGGLLGAVPGLASRAEQWEEVPLDQLRLSFVLQRDGRFGLAASLRF